MIPRPCQDFVDLGRTRIPSDHRKIRNPHEDLKIGCDDMEMRRVVIIGIHPDGDGAKTL